MSKENETIIVELPLKGEWAVPNTPGKCIPSHGTNQYGTRYAYDFLQVDWKRKGWPCYRSSVFQYLLFGVPIHKCYCYGQEIYAPFDGVIVKVENGCKERKRAFLFSDLRRAKRNSRLKPDEGSMKDITGNCIILRHSEGIYGAFVHLRPDSISMDEGQEVKKGDYLGEVGHTGNSMFPHLHFQMMDSCDMISANGIPCAFEQYEVWKEGEWQKVYGGIPTDTDRIRFT